MSTDDTEDVAAVLQRTRKQEANLIARLKVVEGFFRHYAGDPTSAGIVREAADLLTRLAAEIERLQEAKRRALTLADERAWEAAELRQALEKATGGRLK